MDPLLSVPNEDFDRASRCFREGNLKDAADIFARIVAADPQHHDSVRHLGLIAHRIGDHDRAAELISQAILIDPDYAEAFADLADRAAHDGSPGVRRSRPWRRRWRWDTARREPTPISARSWRN